MMPETLFLLRTVPSQLEFLPVFVEPLLFDAKKPQEVAHVFEHSI
jgi:hypothetical protein